MNKKWLGVSFKDQVLQGVRRAVFEFAPLFFNEKSFEGINDVCFKKSDRFIPFSLQI